MQTRPINRGSTLAPAIRRPIVRRDFRRGLRRFTMFNESMAYYDAHPEEWAKLMRIADEIEMEYGPAPPLPRYTKLSLRGEVFRAPGRLGGTHPVRAAGTSTPSVQRLATRDT